MTRRLADLAILLLVPLAVTAAFVFALYVVFWEGPRSLIAVSDAPLSNEPGTYRVALEYGGLQRSYLVHVPPGDSGPRPVVMLLHGAGGNGRNVASATGFVPVSDREGFLLVLPNGVSGAWNDGRKGSGDRDDAGFLEAVLDDMARRLPVQTGRVYVAGISNGAFMVSRLLCGGSMRFAAAALVSGTAPPGFEETCRPSGSQPLIVFLNTEDQIIPYEGGRIRLLLPLFSYYSVTSAADFVDYWAKANACATALPPRGLPDSSRGDDSHVTLRLYRDCASGAAVDFYQIDGAGHTWPGAEQLLSPLLVGATNQDIDATELIWQFFKER